MRIMKSIFHQATSHMKAAKQERFKTAVEQELAAAHLGSEAMNG